MSYSLVIFFHCYNELKFQILSGDGKMLRLSPGIKISISSKTGVRSTIKILTLTSILIVDSLQLKYVGVGLVKADKLILQSTILQLQCQQLLTDALGLI